jgi:hypothetical protein
LNLQCETKCHIFGMEEDIRCRVDKKLDGYIIQCSKYRYQFDCASVKENQQSGQMFLLEKNIKIEAEPSSFENGHKNFETADLI